MKRSVRQSSANDGIFCSAVLTTLCFLFPLFALLLPSHVAAQRADGPAVMEKLDRLERDIMLLQRQVARGGGSYYGSAQGNVESVSAQSEVRLSAIEDELRSIRGKMEENEFQWRQLGERLQKLQEDADLRLRELEYGKTATGNNPSQGEVTTADEPLVAGASDEQPKADGQPAPATTAGDGVLRPPAQPAASESGEPSFSEPREHYNYAFRQLNQTRYDDAARYFTSFIEKYPSDPLIGNAYYWLGETYYIRRDYVNAATQFSQGFEALPNGPKAPDNLLKLAISLGALKRNQEACTVLGRLLVKFKGESTAVTQKAEQERNRIGCQ